MITIVEGDSFHFTPQNVDAIITDPPYALDKYGNMLGHLSPNYRESETHMRGYIDNDRELYQAFLDRFFERSYKQLPKNGLLLSFMGNRTADQLLTAGTRAGFTLMDIIVFTGGRRLRKKSNYAHAETRTVRVLS